jgi:hypothetical protein
MSPRVTPTHRERYRREGFFVLERAIAPPLLALARACCDEGLAANPRARLSAASSAERQHPAFLKLPHQARPELDRLIFSPLFAEICRATIGDEAYLYYDQYVIKAARVGGPLGWHQDSAYASSPHRAYVNCWCALDDVREDNGTIWLLPFARAGRGKLLTRRWNGAHPGTPVIAPAGSVVVFSSLVVHRSGDNVTARPRRSYTVQFSPEPILDAVTGAPEWLARPFLVEGRLVQGDRSRRGRHGKG